MNKAIHDHVVEGLQELYQSNLPAKPVFDWAANRTNDAAETSIERLMQVGNMTRAAAVELARQLADVGCGTFVVGRKGWKSRVQWKYSLVSIGKAAQGREEELDGVDPELAEDAVDQQAQPLAVEAPVSVFFSIDDAKRALAATFNVSPEAIKITISA